MRKPLTPRSDKNIFRERGQLEGEGELPQSGQQYNTVSLCTCENPAENSWHSTATRPRASGCFNHILGTHAKHLRLSLHLSLFLTSQFHFRLSLPSPNLAPRPLCSKRCSLDLPCGPMARNMIYGTRSPTGFRSLLYHRRYIALSVSSLSKRTLASNRCTVNSVPHYRFPSTFPVHIGQSQCPAKRRW